jgi:O-methyltransferase involved in polyketide biosynthesis
MTEQDTASSQETDHSRVAPTAYGVAYLRTFSDIPLTGEIFDALGAHMQDTGQTYTPGTASKDRLAPQLEARYKLVDGLIAASGATQILELAAGIAPRGINLSTTNPDIHYVELDLQGVMQEKQAILSKLSTPKPPNLRIVEGNALSQEDVANAASEFSKDRPVTIVNEGFMRYLTFPEKSILAHNVRGLLTEFGGVWITPDISMRQALSREDEAASGHTQSLRQTTGIDVSQNVFENVEQAQIFFEDLGFEVERHSFLEVSDQLASPAKLDMTAKDVKQLNEPCVAFVMKLAP